MTPDLKYKKYVLTKFLQEFRGYRIYYNDSLDSYWWINPNTKEWRFEMEKKGILWWYYPWGENFKNTLALSEEDFKGIIESYVKMTLNLGVNKFVGSLHINGDTPLMDDLEINVDEYIQGCIDTNKVFPTTFTDFFINSSDFTPKFNIKELYRIDDPATDDVLELLIKAQKDIEIKNYCDKLDVLGIPPVSILKF